MAQEITPDPNGGTPAMLTTLSVESGLVRPFEKVKVYSTGNTANEVHKTPAHTALGEEMEVHPLLAEKLIAAGKATKDKPKTK